MSISMTGCTFTGTVTGGDGRVIKPVVTGSTVTYTAPPAPPVTATLGSKSLQPGDWISVDMLGGTYQHHAIYKGDGDFISRSAEKGGVFVDASSEYAGKKGYFVHRGGEAALRCAMKSIGDRTYNVVTNNCEHFCSTCCGFGHNSAQVKVVGGKLVVLAGTILARHYNVPDSVSYSAEWSGGFTSGGGFGGGFRISF
jgi:hypothetical protein